MGKRITKAATRALLFVSIFFVSVACGSAATLWNLVNVNFGDGATATGYFVMDSTFNNVLSWNVQVSGSDILPAPGADYLYTPLNSSAVLNPGPTVSFGDFGGSPHTNDFLYLALAAPMTNAGGTIALAAGFDCDGANSQCGSLVSGSITSTGAPEPASILTSGCGALVLGMWLYRRRRVGYSQSAS
jgi:hypothetical protein